MGYNISKALTTLGHEVDFLSLMGKDVAGDSVRKTLKTIYIADKHVQALLDETPQSVILYDDAGKRMIHTDLKNIQECSFSTGAFSARKSRFSSIVQYQL